MPAHGQNRSLARQQDCTDDRTALGMLETLAKIGTVADLVRQVRGLHNVGTRGERFVFENVLQFPHVVRERVCA